MRKIHTRWRARMVTRLAVAGRETKCQRVEDWLYNNLCEGADERCTLEDLDVEGERLGTSGQMS